MIPLYRDPHFTFRFADNRTIPRFHLDGIEPGRSVSIFQLDTASGEPRDFISRATSGPDGWVDLLSPLLVKAGEGFVVVVDAE